MDDYIERLVLDYLDDLYKNLRVVQVIANNIDKEIDSNNDILIRLKMMKKYTLIIDAMTNAVIYSIEEKNKNNE